MSINVTVGKREEKPFKLKIQISKLMNNDLYMPGHAHIDVVIKRASGKVLSFPKKDLTDRAYQAEHRLFDFLSKKGVVDPASIQGGNIYGSLEALMYGEEKEKAEQAAIYAINQFLHDEKPLEMLEKELEKEQEEKLLYPDDDESTELGEVPHKDTQGTMSMSANHAGSTAYYFLEQKKKYIKEKK